MLSTFPIFDIHIIEKRIIQCVIVNFRLALSVIKRRKYKEKNNINYHFRVSPFIRFLCCVRKLYHIVIRLYSSNYISGHFKKSLTYRFQMHYTQSIKPALSIMRLLVVMPVAMQNKCRTKFFSYSKYVSYGAYYSHEIAFRIPKKSRL